MYWKQLRISKEKQFVEPSLYTLLLLFLLLLLPVIFVPLLLFWNKISYSPDWPQTCYILKTRLVSLILSWVLRLKVCTSINFFLWAQIVSEVFHTKYKLLIISFQILGSILLKVKAISHCSLTFSCILCLSLFSLPFLSLPLHSLPIYYFHIHCSLLGVLCLFSQGHFLLETDREAYRKPGSKYDLGNSR